ncbi:MAG TPA: TRAP transporter small permease [Hyphomicrobiaceae bacterium]
MKTFMRVADLLLAIAKILTVILMAGMTISILLGVFFRFVVSDPLSWPPEAARFMMVAITMLAGSVAVRQLDHVGVTFLVDSVPPRLRFAAYIVGLVLTALFLALLVVYSFRLTFEAGPLQRAPTLGIPMTVVFFSMPLGAFMMLVQLGASLSEGIKRARSGNSPFEAGETVA